MAFFLSKVSCKQFCLSEESNFFNKLSHFYSLGKILNVREATHKQILENAEINNLIKILGLQYKKKYLSRDDMKTLRYGKIMIMTDQDQVTIISTIIFILRKPK